MSRIRTRAAAVTVLCATALAVPGTAQAATGEFVAAICDELGPDSLRSGESPRAYGDREPVVAWVDVTRRDPRTGLLASHERVVAAQQPLVVEEVCSFDVMGGSVTLGLSFSGAPSQAATPPR